MSSEHLTDLPKSSGAALASRPETPIIDLRHISKTFYRAGGRVEDAEQRAVAALSDVSFTVRRGEFVCLLGPSGCGKTTLLRIMNGLIQPDTGQVIVNGQGSPQPGAWAGFVFQSFRLLPWLTVVDNVAFPLRIQGLPLQERHDRARRWVRLVGLERFGSSYPHELSGGMQQRVALARALAMEPQLLLMDEPFAALDAQTREFMQIELSRIWEARRMSVVFVTHSLDEALFLADRLVLLRPRPGQVEEILDVRMPRPRWEYDMHAQPGYAEIRAHLWNKIRQMVADQPDFQHMLASSSEAAGGSAVSRDGEAPR